jgi:hypothetical protein
MTQQPDPRKTMQQISNSLKSIDGTLHVLLILLIIYLIHKW